MKLKQDRYPVLFLTQGLTKKWMQYENPLNHSIEMATYLALSTGLYGIAAHTEDILRDRNLIRFVKSKGLILFVWGDDLNDREVIAGLKKEGVDGAIYDKLVVTGCAASGTLIFTFPFLLELICTSARRIVCRRRDSSSIMSSMSSRWPWTFSRCVDVHSTDETDDDDDDHYLPTNSLSHSRTCFTGTQTKSFLCAPLPPPFSRV